MYTCKSKADGYSILLQEKNAETFIGMFKDKDLCDTVVKHLNKIKYKPVITDLGIINLDVILNELVVNLKTSLGNGLVKAVLFGSYARGDYRDYSDIDVYILSNLKSRDKLTDIAAEVSADMMTKYNICISFYCDTLEQYEVDKDQLVYTNIQKEGKILYE